MKTIEEILAAYVGALTSLPPNAVIALKGAFLAGYLQGWDDLGQCAVSAEVIQGRVAEVIQGREAEVKETMRKLNEQAARERLKAQTPPASMGGLNAPRL
jgi:hypothetical protein